MMSRLQKGLKDIVERMYYHEVEHITDSDESEFFKN